MDLTHSFTVPASLAVTWATFEDIESVAGCFPGAVVTGVDGDDFTGTCKVKLGPIAMVYSGKGTFLEKDESARRFVVDATGKDKRGNGTAGAVVTATFTEEAPTSTRVDVATDLAITGKPAQFGRGVIEDISNKLLQQFVTCLQGRVTPDEGEASDDPAPSTAGESAVTAPPEQAGPVETAGASGTAETAGVAGTATPPEADDALDLGATVIPILARTYGPQAGIALAALLLGWLLGRRSR